jgi:hypothetical protein
MDISNRDKKDFVFVGGGKYPRQTKSSYTKKQAFSVQTMKVSQLSLSDGNLKNKKQKPSSSTKVMVSRSFNNYEADQFVHIDYYSAPRPLNLVVKNNDTDAKLRKFVYSHFSSPSLIMDHSRVTQLIDLINPWERNIMARLLSNRLITNLQYQYEPPVYGGNALDSTKIGDIKSNSTSFKSESIQTSLLPLESHLVGLFFKYINSANSYMTRDYFELRLKNNFQDIDFQSLLAITLCCACPYLAVEPFEPPINISKLSEHYFERSQNLYCMIDSSSSEVNISKIIILMLTTYNNYAVLSEHYTEVYNMFISMNWPKKFMRTKEEILMTRPVINGPELIYWEQSLFMWCTVNFHLSGVLIGKIRVECLNFDDQLPNLTPALEALYSCPDSSKWTSSHEGRLTYYLFKAQPIFERARLYSRKVSGGKISVSSPTIDYLEKLSAIKIQINSWKNEFTDYCEKHSFNQCQLASTSLLYMYYHFVLISLTLPFIPQSADQLKDPFNFKNFSDFMLSASSISLLMGCQGTWMIILGNGVKNFILALAWSGAYLYLELLNDVDPSINPSTVEVIKDLASVLNDILIKQLTNCLSFKFQKRLNTTLTKRRGVLFWLNIREDLALLNLSLGLKSKPTCIYPPPKLYNNSSLTLLN